MGSTATSSSVQLAATGRQSSVRLAEVLFDPAPGDSPFVELLNAGQTPSDLAGVALGVGDLQLPLARVTAPIAPGTRLLIRFDGQARVEPGVLHLAPSVTLNAESGSVELIDERGERVDRVAWGGERGAVADLAMGATRGRTIGRPPTALAPFDLDQWVVYAPEDVTPGTLNPLPAVQVLLPDYDEIIDGPAVSLDWYAVTGAASYRVQVARDESFASLLVERTTDTPRHEVALPARGRYVWRVQAIAKDGSTARFSAPAGFVVESARLEGGVRDPGLAMSVMRGRGAQAPTAAVPRIHPVPLILQHKDTKMLQLENRRKDHAHGWDRNHGTYDQSDPADSNNCVLASVAMINRWLGGNLSQDRIAYEVRSREGQKYAPLIASAPGMAGFDSLTDAAGIARYLREKGAPKAPEWDLVYGRQDGLTPVQIVAAITYALRPAAPSPRDGGVARQVTFLGADLAFREIKREIDEGRPVIGSKLNGSGGQSRHAFVVRGYDYRPDGKPFLHINDPIRGLRRLPVETMPAADLDWYFLPENPRGVRQEASVAWDSDFDGVVDFDETERFFTDPNSRDSDGDGVWDKDDIASGVFDGTYGYAAHSASTKGRDFDADDIPTERDPDSDDGGCRDGVEDQNVNGERNSPETWNFDDADDLCGEVDGHITWTEKTRLTIGTQISESYSHMVVTVRLREEQPGESGPLVDNGSRFRITATGTLRLAWNGNCQPFARQAGSGSGAFSVSRDAEIGGNISTGGLVVGARATIEGTATADLCVKTGSGPIEMGAGLPDCLGQRVGTSQTYRFSCTKPPTTVMPGLEFLQWSMTGTVTLAPGRKPAP
jgi:hypothetical protein